MSNFKHFISFHNLIDNNLYFNMIVIINNLLGDFNNF